MQLLQTLQGWCDRLAHAPSTDGDALAAALGVTSPEGVIEAIAGGQPGQAHVVLALAEPVSLRDLESAFGVGRVSSDPNTVRYTVASTAARWIISILAHTKPDGRVERITLRVDASEIAERSKRLAQQLLEALDQPEDPDRIAYEVQKDREDREALERFYVATGQKSATTTPEVLVALWDHARTDDDPAFVLAGLSDAGLRRFEVTPVPAALRDATMAAMRRRNVTVGGCYGGAGFAWVIGPELGVWSTTAKVASGTRDELVLASGRVRRQEIEAVVVTVSDDYIERGVALALAGGRTVVVASERDAVAELDPTYGRAELLASDAWWTTWLARELATWLQLPLRDPVFESTVSPTHDTPDRVLAEIEGLAREVDRLAQGNEEEQVTAGAKRGRLLIELDVAGLLAGTEDVRMRVAKYPTLLGYHAAAVALLSYLASAARIRLVATAIGSKVIDSNISLDWFRVPSGYTPPGVSPHDWLALCERNFIDPMPTGGGSRYVRLEGKMHQLEFRLEVGPKPRLWRAVPA
jgi:hypothetical protein